MPYVHMPPLIGFGLADLESWTFGNHSGQNLGVVARRYYQLTLSLLPRIGVTSLQYSLAILPLLLKR
jgi:hypothetical protein